MLNLAAIALALIAIDGEPIDGTRHLICSTVVENAAGAQVSRGEVRIVLAPDRLWKGRDELKVDSVEAGHKSLAQDVNCSAFGCLVPRDGSAYSVARPLIPNGFVKMTIDRVTGAYFAEEQIEVSGILAPRRIGLVERGACDTAARPVNRF